MSNLQNSQNQDQTTDKLNQIEEQVVTNHRENTEQLQVIRDSFKRMIRDRKQQE